ncbi:hypothetical protein [Moraxella lacunata]
MSQNFGRDLGWAIRQTMPCRHRWSIRVFCQKNPAFVCPVCSALPVHVS